MSVQSYQWNDARRSGFRMERWSWSLRLWGLFAQRFGRAEDFFAEHLVVNYCPLAFLEEGGANRTPDKLPALEKANLFSLCDEHLRAVVHILQPEWLLAVGGFAENAAYEPESADSGALQKGRAGFGRPYGLNRL